MIYLIISFFLDIIFSLSFPLAYQNISYFFPIVLISSFTIGYSLIKNKKMFFCLVIVFGIIYDFLYSDIALLNLYYFSLYSLFIYIFYNNKNKSYFNIILISTLGIIFYDFYLFLILNLLNYSDLKIDYLYYKIVHSLFFNIIYILLSVLILKSRIFGYNNYRKKR